MSTHDFTLEDVRNVVTHVVTSVVEASERKIIKTVTEDITAEGRRIDSLGHKIDKLDKRVGNLENKVDNLENKVDNLENKVDNLDHSLRAHISDPRAHRFG